MKRYFSWSTTTTTTPWIDVYVRGGIRIFEYAKS